MEKNENCFISKQIFFNQQVLERVMIGQNLDFIPNFDFKMSKCSNSGFRYIRAHPQ